ncbi:hypothetical protein KY362_04785 [Candidatus Woesearchaeota archaeon]|nr:hypothetical protein [Candidatus Woesearchaeota archaeon]
MKDKSNLARAVEGTAPPRFGEFIPSMKPLYATAEEVMEKHGGSTFADTKYDGHRVQIHRSPKRLKMFTNNGNEVNYACYPDLVQIAQHLPVSIIEAEMIAVGDNHKERFDNTGKRFRRQGISEGAVQKYLESNIVQDIPMTLKIFDTLRFERKGLLHLPLEQRRLYTERFDMVGAEPSETQLITGVEALEALIQDSVDTGEEGIVCKDPRSPYRPGSNTTGEWVKFKRSETLDLVVVGVYRSEDYCQDLPFTSVLVATYNDETGMYETLGKVGVTRDKLAHYIDDEIGEHLQPIRPENVVFSPKLDNPTYSKQVPDLYVAPEWSVVLEIKAMNLNYTKGNWNSCGLDSDGKAYSMRIGFAEDLRVDKDSIHSTTTRAVGILYDLQQKLGKEVV